MQLIVQRGATLPFAQLPPKSIALDGYVQGPALDLDQERFSFDHHDGCIRLLTSATCRQVLDALLLGLNPEPFTVFINDVDGDTVLSVWLLQHPDRVRDPRVRRMVEVVATIDAHGPAYPQDDPERLSDTFFQYVMTPESTARRNRTYATCDLEQLLAVCLQRLDAWFEGRAETPEADEPVAYAIEHQGAGWVLARSEAFAFLQLYNDGITVAVTYRTLPDGSFEYTIGKKSDLVRFPLGPHTKPGTALHALAQAEPGWGGGSTIGGAPRNPDGSRSRLTPAQVIALLDGLSR